jgi:hypothetical protein
MDGFHRRGRGGGGRHVGHRLGRRSSSCRLNHIRDNAQLVVRGSSNDNVSAVLLKKRVKRSLKEVCGGGYRGVDDKERLTASQIVTWESAGLPVHPQYCSSPIELTTIGSSRVP